MHEGTKINCSLIYDHLLPYTKGVWIGEDHGEAEKFDLGLERWPVVQVEGTVWGRGMEVCRCKEDSRSSKCSDIEHNFSSFFEYTFYHKTDIGRVLEAIISLWV